MKKIRIDKIKAFSLFEMSITLLAISIMVGLIVKGSDLIRKYRLQTARTLTISSDVNNIDDLVLWLDATKKDAAYNINNSSNLADGDKIKLWKSFNSQNNKIISFGQNNSSHQPIFALKGLNNLPAIKFNYSNPDTLESEDYEFSLSPENFTIFTVTKPISKTSSFGAVFSNRNTGNKSGYTLFTKNNSTYWTFWTGTGNGGDPYTQTYNTPYKINSNKIIYN